MEGLELELRLKESMEWGYNYYTEELKALGYTHQAKGNELEVYDGNGTLAGKSYLEKEGQVTTRRFEAAAEVPEQVEELSNQLLLIKISLGYSERDIALLQQESLAKEPAAEYGVREEVPARIFPAAEHGNLRNIAFEGIPSEGVRNHLKEHGWRYSRRNRAWYPGTREARATNEAFAKDFLLRDDLETLLNATAVELPELPVTRDNYKVKIRVFRETKNFVRRSYIFHGFYKTKRQKY